MGGEEGGAGVQWCSGAAPRTDWQLLWVERAERVRGVQSQLRSEQRVLDREIRSLDQASNKTKAEAKRLAKKGDTKNARMLAKEIAMGRHRRERLVVGKARMNSIQLQLQQQVAMYKVTGAMQKSSEVMKLSNQLIKLPQLQQSMRMMSQEMMKVRLSIYLSIYLLIDQ